MENICNDLSCLGYRYVKFMCLRSFATFKMGGGRLDGVENTNSIL